MSASLHIVHRELREVRLQHIHELRAVDELVLRADDDLQRVALRTERERRVGVHGAPYRERVADGRRAAHHSAPEPLRLDGHVLGRGVERVGEVYVCGFPYGGGFVGGGDLGNDLQGHGVDDGRESCAEEWNGAKVD